MRAEFFAYFRHLQAEIGDLVEMMEGKAKFRVHSYSSLPEEGHLKLLQNGQVLDKGSLHFYTRQFAVDPTISSFLEVKDATAQKVYENGLVLVFHPKNPNAPSVLAHWQYSELLGAAAQPLQQWVRCGMNLVPHYLIAEDAVYFHKVCKEVCQAYHPDWYNRFKKECDRYYYNDLRSEALGIGGLYTGRLQPSKEGDLPQLFSFTKDLGEAFIPSYMPILERRKDAPSVVQHKQWQAFRRSRFTEFGFLADPRFSFFLRQSAHPDAVLAGLPPQADFAYEWEPEQGSREAKLVQVLKAPKDWI